MENPFEKPENVDEELNQEVMTWILEKIKEKNLNFHKALGKLETCTDNKNIKKSKIWAYYCVNMILKNKSYSEHQKLAAISDIVELINNI